MNMPFLSFDFVFGNTILVDSYDAFIRVHQGCFTATWASVQVKDVVNKQVKSLWSSDAIWR